MLILGELVQKINSTIYHRRWMGQQFYFAIVGLECVFITTNLVGKECREMLMNLFGLICFALNFNDWICKKIGRVLINEQQCLKSIVLMHIGLKVFVFGMLMQLIELWCPLSNRNIKCAVLIKIVSACN